MFAFAALGSVSLVLSQEIGCKKDVSEMTYFVSTGGKTLTQTLLIQLTVETKFQKFFRNSIPRPSHSGAPNFGGRTIAAASPPCDS